jgi:hypothetical protein
MVAESGELKPAGRVKYGERAFEQDAQEAMRGDIVRGLIELITNADDAYARARGAGGKILVEVEHRRGAAWNIVVRDRATGMSLKQMKSRLGELGGRSSGFESGQAVRGTLGRGAKDLPAFGPTLWESVKADQYAALQILPTGEIDALPRPRRVTQQDRRRLGIPRGNGMAVTVRVRDNVRCPNHATLRRRLSCHFQLRDIMADPEREVLLSNVNNPSEKDRLRYVLLQMDLLRSTNLAIEGYPGVQASLDVWRLPERCDDQASDACRPGGILIKGRRAIYDNTLFSFEGSPYAAYLHGRIICEHIDTLAQEYDDRSAERLPPTEENPMPIVGRTRDSLRREHPFYKALREAVEPVLQQLVREEEERVRKETITVENEQTRRDLDRAAREATRFMEDELRDAEAEGLPEVDGLGAAKPLAIVPAETVCYLGETKTLRIIAQSAGLDADSTASLSMDPEGVVEFVNESLAIPLHPHRKRADLLVGHFELRPLLPDVSIVQCGVSGRKAEAMVTVLEERSPVTAPPAAPPPATLEFEHRHYRIGWTRRKTLTLRAPLDKLSAGTTVHIRSNNTGVAVLTPQASMGLDASASYLVGHIRVEGRALGAEATVSASAGDLMAGCLAAVSRDEAGPSLQFVIEDKDSGKYRAVWEDRDDQGTGNSVKVLVIQARHPALSRYLGDAPIFPGQQSPWTRLLLAEILADNVCREVGRRVDELRSQDERPDAEGFYSEHYGRTLKLLPRLQQAMLPALPYPPQDSLDD